MRFTVQELEARWLVTMRTYCQLVKNSGGLNGADKLKHFRRSVQSGELFVKHLAAKRQELKGNMIYYHGGIVYFNPLATENSELAHREFKVYAPHSVANMFSEHMINSQMMPVYRKVANEGSEVVKFLARHLLLEIPGEENRRCFVSSLSNASELALQTASIRQLKYKYLGYSTSLEEQKHYKAIIDDLSRKDELIRIAEGQRLKKRRMLADIRVNATRRTTKKNKEHRKSKGA